MSRPDRNKQQYVAEEHVSESPLSHSELSAQHEPCWRFGPANVDTLINELTARGWHQTDILDAVDEARRAHRHGA